MTPHSELATNDTPEPWLLDVNETAQVLFSLWIKGGPVDVDCDFGEMVRSWVEH